MLIDTLRDFIKNNKYTLKIARGILLLLIYELVGYVFFYLYKQYKIYKSESLAIKNNKKYLYLDNLNKLKTLSSYNNDSCVILFDDILIRIKSF